MKDGPRYHIPFRRRREGKTNYHRRLKLIRSRRNRLIIRCSLKHTVVQVAESLIQGDKILAQAHSKQLSNDFGWVYGSGNQSTAYLTGYLAGLRAKKAGIEDAILDVGIMVHNERVKAAFKGFLDAEVEVPHEDEWFSESLEERVTGAHIQKYAEMLQKDDKDKYKKMFSGVLNKKGDPTKLVNDFNKTKEAIAKKV